MVIAIAAAITSATAKPARGKKNPPTATAETKAIDASDCILERLFISQ
jgi:hypothetical protein